MLVNEMHPENLAVRSGPNLQHNLILKLLSENTKKLFFFLVSHKQDVLGTSSKEPMIISQAISCILNMQ